MSIQFLWRSLFPIMAIAGSLYIIAGLFLYFQQTRFIFFPRATIDTTPAAFNLDFQEVWLPVKIGNRVEKMHSWWIPASTPSNRVLLYLHGNGINIGANVAHANRFHRMEFSVLLPDYRGYGLSQGNFPSESQVYQDARVAWDYLVKEKKIPANRIFIYGHSLGGAVAIDLAVKQPKAAGLIVESSFTSVADMVNHQQIYRIFPIDLLLHQRFDSIDKVGSLAMSVLFIHGTADWQVPASMSQQLYQAAPQPKQIFLVPEAGHNNTAEVAGSKYFQVVQQFVRQVENENVAHQPKAKRSVRRKGAKGY
ncbi:alpha/beta fold hydrolase [Chroococcidiopsis sp. FACHB-1243]|uniref:alpha/beta hydrolase n=1 Tax=Chroococcidiopsis sp. [FACHB-1243] TaxID=2692781 RepID=UPI00177D1FB9|nr:alpha/beta fold hydrolase [Chroococcidiopsis sp. [FACHB-1243]]MBD2305397.1 alpha/beta fold hydrolase [Chroococcidiopsis sp. [FACHB-1243]]